MHDAPDFLRALTIVLCVAAGTTVGFHRLRQPVGLGYIIAGLIVGPHRPFPLGLEFSFRKLMQVGPRAGLTAILETSIMVWLGFLTGRLFGWTALQSLFAGAVIAISSTT